MWWLRSVESECGSAGSGGVGREEGREKGEDEEEEKREKVREGRG